MCRALVINIAKFAFIIITLGISMQDDRPSDSLSQMRHQSDIILFPSSSEMTNNYQHFHHQHHYHDADFHHHHHHHHHPDQVFNEENGDDSSDENAEESFYDTSSRIPLDLIWKVNNFTDVNDLLLNMVEGNEQEDQFLASRFGDGERSGAIAPKAAGCIPELQTVKITSDDDPSVLYIPSCTRIERCGGCCSHNLLSCQPTATETVSYQVVKTQFTGGSKFKFVGKEVVLVEKHTKCKCDCRVHQEDCSSFQEYRKSECRCACTNTDEEKKCYKENATKLWNPEICACQCRNTVQCSTGYRFDTFRCKCGPISVRRRFAELKGSEKTNDELETPAENIET